MTQRPTADRPAPAQPPEHGCWAGGCLGGPVGAVLVPIDWYFWMIREQIDFDIVASMVLMYLIPIGFIVGILLGSAIGSIIYYGQRYYQRRKR